MVHRLVYSGVNYHVAISKHLLANVKTILPYYKNIQLRVIYPSFHVPEKSESTPEKDKTLKIVHVGRVVPGKGHRDAILACAVLYDKGVDFELFFYGSSEDEKYKEEILDLISGLTYKSKIFFSGHVDNVSEQLEKADIFLYPSYGEGFGNVFIEAMSNKLSVVTYNNTTFPEFIQMGFNFRMAVDGDIDSLSAKLLDAANCIDEEVSTFEENAALVGSLFRRDRERADWLSVLV